MASRRPDATQAPPPGPFLRLVSNQKVAFLCVGAFNTVNGYMLFVVAQRLTGDTFVGYMSALLVSHVIAVLCAFVLHRRLVFRVRGHVLLDLARFEMVNLGALGLNALLLPLFVEWVGLDVLIAQLAAGGIAVCCTYVAHRSFSFRRSASPLEKASL